MPNFLGFFDKFLIYFALRYNIQILNEQNNNNVICTPRNTIYGCKNNMVKRVKLKIVLKSEIEPRLP